ncbi:MAG: hypothetical protein HOP30_22020 [Cyclobacteriaceae bacterium]|nr:hypothetical protein [Cyclobacteriaceae bacterium]
MKLIITTFLFVLTTAILFGQSNGDEPYRNIDEIKLVDELEHSQQKLNLSLQHKEYLEDGIVQTHWIWKKQKRNKTIYFMTLSIGGKIFYREFYKRSLTEDFERMSYETLHTSVDNFLLDRVNKTRQSEINVDHLSRLPKRSVFGEACFYSATLPEDGLEMMKLVKEKNVTELEQSLRSINPVKQVYAYLGLKLLQATDSIQITDESTKRMMELEKSTTAVYSCSGCTQWEFIAVKDHLTSENVTRFMNRWKRTK